VDPYIIPLGAISCFYLIIPFCINGRSGVAAKKDISRNPCRMWVPEPKACLQSSSAMAGAEEILPADGRILIGRVQYSRKELDPVSNKAISGKNTVVPPRLLLSGIEGSKQGGR
jgi:hypothetical protein